MTAHKLKTPTTEPQIRKLKTNDTLYITGTIITARDQAHKRALEYAAQGKPLPINLEGSAIYHCGPLMNKKDNTWTAIAAGPTTSTRLEPLEAKFIEKFKARLIIGKGGMGEKTIDAMAKYGAVYCAFTGGAAALAAEAIKRVKNVEWLDLGKPEAMWIFEVEEFGPLLVAIDAHGNSLFRDIAEKVETNRYQIYRKLNL